LVNIITSLTDTKLFVKRSVGQFLTGYEDELLEIATQYFPELIKSNVFSFTFNVIQKIYSKITELIFLIFIYF
jgi:hypothetical protein